MLILAIIWMLRAVSCAISVCLLIVCRFICMVCYQQNSGKAAAGGNMFNKLDAVLQFQQQALNLREQRQQILSANIANADTPGYQARDIDFSSALRKAVERGETQRSFAMTVTSARHIPGQINRGPDVDLLYRVPDQPALDGNTVDMDRERAQFMDNSLKYQSDLTLLGGQIKSMLSVLQQGG